MEYKNKIQSVKNRFFSVVLAKASLPAGRQGSTLKRDWKRGLSAFADNDKKIVFIAILITGFSFIAVHRASASVLAVNNPAGDGDVLVTLNTQGQSVNAVEAHLGFDPSEFSIASISDAVSLVNVWIERPAFSNDSGTVDFSGIIPGGVSSSGGKIITVTIIPRKAGASKGFSVISATVLLNDGKGTPAKLSTASNGFLLSLQTSSTPVPVTNQSPDVFVPKIGKDPNLFNGQYFLAFSATDQYSGIDHYDVLEAPRNVKVSDHSIWQTAESPYLLKDQTLSSNIYVRAVDQAGNSRIVEVPAPFPAPIRNVQWEIPIILLLLIAGVIALLRLRKSRKSKKNKS
jgi:hypothetical protein